MKKITLTQGKRALVDDDDFEFINQWKWCAALCKCARWVAQRGVISKQQKKKTGRKNRTTLLMHRLITNCPKNLGVDHINGNTLDNRKSNLRIQTNQGNLRGFRSKRAGTSKFRGVYWHKRLGKWCAAICSDYNQVHLGYFITENDAAKAYDCAARQLGFHREALNSTKKELTF